MQGARGTVVFTDLLNLTTAPGQRVEVDAVNPGIEINDGVVHFSLTDGTRLMLEGAEWPFLGGQLTMQPLLMNIGRSEKLRRRRSATAASAGTDLNGRAAQFAARHVRDNLAAFVCGLDGVGAGLLHEAGRRLQGLLRGGLVGAERQVGDHEGARGAPDDRPYEGKDRKSTRLNSSH